MNGITIRRPNADDHNRYYRQREKKANHCVVGSASESMKVLEDAKLKTNN